MNKPTYSNIVNDTMVDAAFTVLTAKRSDGQIAFTVVALRTNEVAILKGAARHIVGVATLSPNDAELNVANVFGRHASIDIDDPGDNWPYIGHVWRGPGYSAFKDDGFLIGNSYIESVLGPVVASPNAWLTLEAAHLVIDRDMVLLCGTILAFFM